MVTLPKDRGELGIPAFELQASALKIRLASRILTGDNTEWIRAISAINKSPNTPGGGWRSTLLEFLLLGPRPTNKQTPAVKWILGGWVKARRSLQFDPGGAEIPSDLPIAWIKKLMSRGEPTPDIDWKALRQLFRKYWIFILRDLVNGQRQLRLIPGLGSWLDQHGDTRRHLQQMFGHTSDDDDEDQGVAAPDTRTEGERDPPYRGHPDVNEGEDVREQLS
ncbi:hypothetical protein R1sor_001883 [Riccia sorocarpa]|uniref:Uncharacterized protein n=1 Tax=Riccia sorocarpa TaxID=122646 RepID=A0ABD3H1E3_9MARC